MTVTSASCQDSDWYNQGLFFCYSFHLFPSKILGELQIETIGDQKNDGKIPWIIWVHSPHFGLKIDWSLEKGRALFVIICLRGCHSGPNWTPLNFILFLLVIFLGSWEISCHVCSEARHFDTGILMLWIFWSSESKEKDLGHRKTRNLLHPPELFCPNFTFTWTFFLLLLKNGNHIIYARVNNLV